MKDAKTAYKEKVALKEKDAFRFIPLYLPQKKECLMVYAEDLFLRHLEMSQTIDLGFRYKMVKSNRLPPFFERNEAMLMNLGLKVQRMSSTTAKAKFSVLDSDLELAGFDELAAKKRLQYAQPDPKPQPSIESSTEPPKSARKRSATPKTPQSGDLPPTAANKTLKKPKKTEAN